MDITLSEDQELFQRAARDFLRREHPSTAVRDAEVSDVGYSPAMYRQLADLGYLGLLIPEEDGGSGGTWLNAAIFHEEAGRALLAGPYMTTTTGALALLNSGSTKQRARLPRVAAGESFLALAVAEEDGTTDASIMSTRAEQMNGGWTVTGSKSFVPYADSADALIVTARTEPAGDAPAIGLFLVDAGPGIETRRTAMMSGERYCTVTMTQAAAEPFGAPDEGAALLTQVLQESAILEAARAVGSAAQLLDMAVEYSKGRVQFGRPIGAFQALQHMMADLATDVDGSRLLVYYAAWLRDEGLPWEPVAAMARFCAANTYRHAARTGHQIHGGYGFIMDTDVQLYVRRAKLAEVNLTGSERQREAIAASLGIS